MKRAHLYAPNVLKMNDGEAGHIAEKVFGDETEDYYESPGP